MLFEQSIPCTDVFKIPHALIVSLRSVTLDTDLSIIISPNDLVSASQCLQHYKLSASTVLQKECGNLSPRDHASPSQVDWIIYP